MRVCVVERLCVFTISVVVLLEDHHERAKDKDGGEEEGVE